MNKINYLNVFTVLLFLGALSLQRLQAQNRPVVQTKFTADPAPMVHNGTVYLYTSHDEDDAPEGMGRFLMKEWLLYSSTDMVNWTDHGAVASLKNFEWTENKENGAWAPHCIERNGKFVYISHSSDARMDGGVKIELDSFLIRTARHVKDYTGGINQYCDMSQLQSMIDKLLS